MATTGFEWQTAPSALMPRGSTSAATKDWLAQFRDLIAQGPQPDYGMLNFQLQDILRGAGEREQATRGNLAEMGLTGSTAGDALRVAQRAGGLNEAAMARSQADAEAQQRYMQTIATLIQALTGTRQGLQQTALGLQPPYRDNAGDFLQAIQSILTMGMSKAAGSALGGGGGYGGPAPGMSTGPHGTGPV